jgi:hypothetical protein
MIKIKGTNFAPEPNSWIPVKFSAFVFDLEQCIAGLPILVPVRRYPAVFKM